jgi:uncharacterized membrane protein (DUF373 family)
MNPTLEYDIDYLLRIHQISKKDSENIKFLKTYLDKYKKEFVEILIENLYKFPELHEALTSEFIEKFKKRILNWYNRLFSGKYDYHFLNYLISIGETFFNLGFSPHHVIVFMDITRNFFNTKIFEIISEQTDKDTIRKLRSALKSLNKVLDLNLDIIISYYVDTEMKTLLAIGKLGRSILLVAKKFGLLLDSSILTGLIILAAFIIYLFVNDIFHMFSGDITHAIIAALGDLLILWTILELLNSQIKFMLGGEFAISSFVSVALAATIREALITSLEHNKPVEFKLALAVIILVLGIVFGIVKWFEIRGKSRRVKLG